MNRAAAGSSVFPMTYARWNRRHILLASLGALSAKYTSSLEPAPASRTAVGSTTSESRTGNAMLHHTPSAVRQSLGQSLSYRTRIGAQPRPFTHLNSTIEPSVTVSYGACSQRGRSRAPADTSCRNAPGSPSMPGYRSHENCRSSLPDCPAAPVRNAYGSTLDRSLLPTSSVARILPPDTTTSPTLVFSYCTLKSMLLSSGGFHLNTRRQPRALLSGAMSAWFWNTPSAAGVRIRPSSLYSTPPPTQRWNSSAARSRGSNVLTRTTGARAVSSAAAAAPPPASSPMRVAAVASPKLISGSARTSRPRKKYTSNTRNRSSGSPMRDSVTYSPSSTLSASAGSDTPVARTAARLSIIQPAPSRSKYIRYRTPSALSVTV